MAEAVTVYELRVDCNVPYHKIEGLEWSHGVNRHGRLWGKLSLGDTIGDYCLEDCLDRDTRVKVWNGKTGQVYFQGIIRAYELMITGTNHYIEFEAAGVSCLLDVTKHSRSYQDIQMSYRELFDDVCQGIAYSGQIDLSGPVERWFLQYQMTDWDFLKMVAYRLNSFIVADESWGEVRLYIGLPEKENVGVQPMNYRLLREFNRSDRTVQTGQVENCLFTGTQCYRIGDFVTVSQQRFYIMERAAKLERGELVFSYKCREKKFVRDDGYMSPDYTGLSLRGSVLAVDGYRIKLHLDIDSHQDQDKAVWFPYTPEGSNVFYYMPEIGSTVWLMLGDRLGDMAFGMNAVRTFLPGEVKLGWLDQPQTKLISNKEKKAIALAPDQILVSGIEGQLYITLNDAGGIVIESTAAVDMSAEDVIHLSGDGNIGISAQKSILLQASDSSSIYIENDVQLHSEYVHVSGTDTTPRRMMPDSRLNGRPLDAAMVVTGLMSSIPVQMNAAIDNSSLTAMFGMIPALANAVMGSGYDYQALTARGATIERESGPDGFNKVHNLSQSKINPVKEIEKGGAKLAGISGKFCQEQAWKQHRQQVGSLPGQLFSRYTGMHHPANRMLRFDPIDVVTGELVYRSTDLDRIDEVPISWSWIWSSHCQDTGMLGHGIFHSLEMRIIVIRDRNQLLVINEEGRGIVFPFIVEGQPYVHPLEGYSLELDGYELMLHCLESGARYLFEVKTGAECYRLSGFKKGHDEWIRLTYNPQNQLTEVIYAPGNKIILQYNDSKLLEHVIREKGRIRQNLVVYNYNFDHDLISVTKRDGSITKFRYRNHLMIQRIDSDRQSFYWNYEQVNGIPKVSKTWSDGGQLSGRFAWQRNRLVTEVLSGEDNRMKVFYDEQGLIRRVIRQTGGMYNFIYNDLGQLMEFQDEHNRRQRFHYNRSGMLDKITDPEQNEMSYTYDAAGRLTAIEHQGKRLEYSYDSDNRLDHIWDQDGRYVFLSYNEYGDITRITDETGAAHCWEYDTLGRCSKYQTAGGGSYGFAYDKNGIDITGVTKGDWRCSVIKKDIYSDNSTFINGLWSDYKVEGMKYLHQNISRNGLLDTWADYINTRSGTLTLISAILTNSEVLIKLENEKNMEVAGVNPVGGYCSPVCRPRLFEIDQNVVSYRIGCE